MKIFILTIFIILISHTVKSQSFYGGLDLGFVISQVDGDNHGGYHKIAPAGGVFVRNTFKNPNLGTSTGISYKNKGSKAIQRDENDVAKEIYSIDLHYIEIPVTFCYKIEELSIPGLLNYYFKKDLYFKIGASYSYLIKGKEYFNNLDYRTKSFKKYELAIHTGLSYRLTDHWLLSYIFSYTFPLTPIHPHPGEQTYRLNRGLYNNSMNFSFIYEF